MDQRSNQNRNHHNGKGSPYKSRQNRRPQAQKGPAGNTGRNDRKQQNDAVKPVKKAEDILPKAGSLLTLMDGDGCEYDYDILASWVDIGTKKRYVIYTDHDLDLDGNEQFYAALCQITGGELDILPIEDERDWEIVEAQAQQLR